jgi:hypothetical protein
MPAKAGIHHFHQRHILQNRWKAVNFFKASGG